MRKNLVSLILILATLIVTPAATAAPGDITTVAGTGNAGFNGDGIAATSAQLNRVQGVAADSAGNIFIADDDNNRIRRVDAETGLISTVAGTGSSGYSGDGGLATAAQLNAPIHVSVDPAGNLFITELDNDVIRRVDAATGIISTVAGTGTRGFNGDGVAATAAQLNSPLCVAIDAGGNLYIADNNNERIRKVDAETGLISTVAGTGVAGFSGDGGGANFLKSDYFLKSD